MDEKHLPKGNRLKENFYAATSIMKPLDLRYQKIDMCPNFCMLYYFENIELTECMTCGHSRYKLKTNMRKTLVVYKIFVLYFTVRNILLSFWKWDEIEKYEIYGINKIKSIGLWHIYCQYLQVWKIWVVSSIGERCCQFYFTIIKFDYVIIN